MAVTLAEITKLRGLTGAGMMDCKAFIETEGDMDAAVRCSAKGQAVAAKREDRQLPKVACSPRTKVRLRRHRRSLLRNRLRCQERIFRRAHRGILDTAIAQRVKSSTNSKKSASTDAQLPTSSPTKPPKTGEKIELGRYEYLEAPSTTSYNHLGNNSPPIAGFNLEG